MERKGFLIKKAFNKYVWASILTVATAQIANIVDASLVGNIIGSEGLAAVVISKPILQAIYAISCLYIASCTMMAGMALGNGNKKKANSLFSFSLIVSLVLGIIITIGGIVFIDPLLDTFCKSDEMRPLAKPFMIVTILSALPQLFMLTLQQFVTIDGSPKLVSRAVIIGNIVNLCMDYVFMKYLGMGIAGAGWATFLMYVVCILMLIPHFRRKGTLRSSFDKLKEHVSYNQVLTLGTPFFLSTVLLSVQYTCNNNIATTFIGNDGLISYAVCLQLFAFSMIIITGILRTIQPVGAILKGIGDSRGIVMLLVRSYRFMIYGLVIYTLLIVFFPEQIAAFLGVSDPVALPTIHQALPAFSLNIIMQALLCVLLPIYQFYGHNRMALFLSIGQTLLPIVGFWALARGDCSTLNPWFGFFLGQVLTAFILLVFSLLISRKENSLPVILIPRDRNKASLEFSFSYAEENLQDSFNEMSNWLKQQNLREDIIFKVRVIAEELMMNIIQHSHSLHQLKCQAYADMRMVVHTDDDVTFTLTDDGKPFNPVMGAAAKSDRVPSSLGLTIVNGISSEITYNYQLGQNMTTVKVK